MAFSKPFRFSSDVSQIDSNVFLGSLEAAVDPKVLKSLKIRRIVSLDVVPLESKQKDISYLYIKARDEPNEDLLSRFEECHRFITEGVLKCDNVLVHCMAGVSRSATIVVSYIMAKNKMSYAEAMILVRKKRSVIDPNDGFRRQLIIFERMNRKLDPMNGEYRLFLVENLRNRIRLYRHWVWSTSAHTTSLSHLDNYFQKLRHLTEERNGNDRREDVYKCKKCGFDLFNEFNVIKKCDKSDDSVCDFIYVEPLQWMAEYIGRQESGTINCPNCLSELGQFNWHRISCQCDRHKSLECLNFKIDSKNVDLPLNS